MLLRMINMPYHRAEEIVSYFVLISFSFLGGNYSWIGTKLQFISLKYMLRVSTRRKNIYETYDFHPLLISVKLLNSECRGRRVITNDCGG